MTNCLSKYFLLVVVICVWLVGCGPKGPIVQVDQSDWDFGLIQQHSKIEHVLYLKNVGDQLLKIEKVKSTCGCTVAKPDKRELEPGESTEIKMTFNSGRLKGEQRRKVRIFTNDPHKSPIVFTVTGLIIKRIVFKPKRMNFYPEGDSTTFTNSAVAINVSGEYLDINEARIKPEARDRISVKVEADGNTDFPISLPPDGEMKLIITLKANAKEPNFFTQIDLVSDDGMFSTFNIYSGKKKGNRLNPEKVKLKPKMPNDTK